MSQRRIGQISEAISYGLGAEQTSFSSTHSLLAGNDTVPISSWRGGGMHSIASVSSRLGDSLNLELIILLHTYDYNAQ